jgi:hypothetical protein
MRRGDFGVVSSDKWRPPRPRGASDAGPEHVPGHARGARGGGPEKDIGVFVQMLVKHVPDLWDWLEAVMTVSGRYGLEHSSVCVYWGVASLALQWCGPDNALEFEYRSRSGLAGEAAGHAAAQRRRDRRPHCRVLYRGAGGTRTRPSRTSSSGTVSSTSSPSTRTSGKQALESLRLAARLLTAAREDPDTEKIVVQGNGVGADIDADSA